MPIQDYSFEVIRMNKRGNEDFDFVDMFVRLNQNNTPLFIDSYENWNSFDIVSVLNRIKEIAKYPLLKQLGKRMKEAELVTLLAYMDYHDITIDSYEKILSIFLRTENKTKRNETTQVKFSLNKQKHKITEFLENIEPGSKDEEKLMKSVENVNEFIYKLKILSGDEDDRLLKIFNPHTTRQVVAKYNDFYTVWLFLKELDTHVVLTYRREILKDLEKIFELMKNMPAGKREIDFIEYVKSIIDEYLKYCRCERKK